MKWNLLKFIGQWIQKPDRVLVVCLILILFNVVVDGTLFQIRKLYLNKKTLDNRIQTIQTKNQILVEKLHQLSDPKHLEQEVRNRFDLAGQGDLIFIFPEDE